MRKPAIAVLPGGSFDIEEPAWGSLIPDGRNGEDNASWREFAHREWLRVVTAMRAAGTLAPENRHQMQRLVIAYVRYDRAASEFFAVGLITKAPKTGVPMVNIVQSEMRQADADATTIEKELGLPPRHRGAVKKANRAEKTTRQSDRYLAKPLSA
jgi:phage terminase small subunit